MAQDILVSILVYLSIFQNPSAAALPLASGLKKHELSLSTDCPNCGRLEKKIRREMGAIFTKDAKSKYMKNLVESFYEYKFPRKANSLWKGWGARGMPFNVLYTPNIQQQRMMKYVPQRQEERKTRKKQGKHLPLIYNLVLEDEKPPKTKGKTLQKHFVPRKYYSVIPQLFVSYGW